MFFKLLANQSRWYRKWQQYIITEQDALKFSKEKLDFKIIYFAIYLCVCACICEHRCAHLLRPEENLGSCGGDAIGKYDVVLGDELGSSAAIDTLNH